MRIGIEFLFAKQGTTQGYDSCLRNLLTGLDSISRDHEIIVFCNTPYYHENKSKFFNLQLVDCQGQWQNRIKRAAWLSVSLPGLIRRFKINGVYFPTHFRSLMGLGKVWTVSNLHDLQYRYIPSSFGHFQLLVRDYFYKLSLIKSNKCICISEYVKSTIREQFPSIPTDRLIVLPNPITFDDRADNLYFENNLIITNRRYILTIGMHFPHKNFETLIRAFAILIKETEYSGLLVLGGGFTSHTPILREIVEELKIADRVHFMGYISNAIRETLYRSADVFVFPSLYEGFGMPVVEAMGRKIPVVCSQTTALPETTLGLAEYYSKVTDPAALAQAIKKTLQLPPSEKRLQEISNQIRQLYNPETISRKYIDLWDSFD